MRHAFPVNLVLPAASSSARTVRQQLTEQLRAALLSGQVTAGEPLPSTRALAAALGVARGTIVSVYEDLAGEGFIVSSPGSGTYVTHDLPLLAAIATAGASSHSSGGETRLDTSRSKQSTNLWPGSPSRSLYKSGDWASALRNTARHELPGLPPPPAGDSELRDNIAHHLRALRGVNCTGDDIVVTAGTSEGLGLLLQGLRPEGPGGVRIATENPGYHTAREVISGFGALPVPVPVRDGGMDSSALARVPEGVAAALLTPSHQYPLGGRLPIAARLAMLAWASETGAFIFEDDYDSEFRHGSPSLPAIASLDTDNRVVLIGSTSKTITPWLRCGYLVISNPELRARVIGVRRVLGQPVSGLVQVALAEFMHTGGLRRHLVRVGREYAHRRSLVIEATADLPAHMQLDAIEGGLHATISWTGAPSSEHVVARLAEREIQVASLRTYYYEGSQPRRNGLVFGYGAPTDLQLRHALIGIADVLRST